MYRFLVNPLTELAIAPPEPPGQLLPSPLRAEESLEASATRWLLDAE